jgi:nicotinamide mononucleotide transporter
MELIQQSVMEAFAAMQMIEILAVAFGLIYIYYAAKGNMLCWPAALVSVSLYIYLCWEVQLYAEAALQGYYWIMAIYGWWSWSASGSGADLPISELSMRNHLLIICGGLVGVVITGALLHHYTDAALPYVDAFTTLFSLITTVMVARKILSNWLYWFVIDSVAIYLYASRGLYLTALLFVAYVVIVIFGYLKWKQLYKQQNV